MVNGMHLYVQPLPLSTSCAGYGQHMQLRQLRDGCHRVRALRVEKEAKRLKSSGSPDIGVQQSKNTSLTG